MASEFSFGDAADYFGLQDLYGVAQEIGANSSYITPRTSDTVTSNAIDGAAPIDNSGGGAWGGFWRDGLKTVLGYSVARDAARNGVGAQAPMLAPQGRQSQAAALPGWVLPVAVVGVGLVAVLLLKGK